MQEGRRRNGWVDYPPPWTAPAASTCPIVARPPLRARPASAAIMIVHPERLRDSELEYRTKYQVTVNDRETGAPLQNGARTLLDARSRRRAD